ncbi:zinc finger and SCAN domain-containing protein 4-like [Choloepus didactylus]|uniref:zinc finger and SCAN domain-containing protein 4-like n=1 Tax=Choloepus didactylus TaxID=27675 RepID=UPI00189E12FD|nr:zinc finger and SCAN domain-containing protein 4-like [Choloepus didactylus]
MALDLRTSFHREPSRSDPGSENLEPEPTQRPGVQKGKGTSEFQSPQLSSFQNGNSRAKQELQRLHKYFHSWLKPEKHTKDEIISQLVLEQFVLNGQSRNRSSLQEKWDSSGRHLEKFMEDLTDDCMYPPGLVRVHMQGQEALFPENMPLREVIIHLTGQSSAETPTGQSVGTPCWDPRDTPLQTGQGDENKEDGSNISVKTTQVNDSITSQGNEVPSPIIIWEENCPKSEEGEISQQNSQNSGRAGLGSSRSQEGSPGGPSYDDVPMEMDPQLLPRPDQATPGPVPPQQSNKGKPRCEVIQERVHSSPKSYRCEDCSRIFRYPSQLDAHQRRHRNERPFVCAECHRGFFQISHLRVHQKIHAVEKPFKCSTCEKSFSHKTNLQAHERIHTGEKPYTCSLCKRSYRQSSTYHRHVRNHQKINLKSDPATPEASPATALTKDT